MQDLATAYWALAALGVSAGQASVALAAAAVRQVLSLLALLVPKYRY
jgi:hypothetical protein